MAPRENGTSWPSWTVVCNSLGHGLQVYAYGVNAYGFNETNLKYLDQKNKFEVPGISVDAHLTDGPRGTSGLG
jgi:hypothetical protein